VADKTAYVLTEGDLAKLRETMDYVSSIRRNKPILDSDSYQSSSPDVYVALIPFGGISGIAPITPQTGTGVLTLGAPSKASCNIYQIVPDDVSGTTPQFMPVSDTSLDVYNVSTQAIPGDSWAVVVRDKYGVWIATGAPSAVGALIVDHVHVVGIPATGTGTHFPPQWYCVSVKMTSPGGALVETGTVYNQVRESQNVEPRIFDAAGAPTHIIPLFQDVDGNHYICFPRLYGTAKLTVPSDPSGWTFNFNTTTCTMTVTPSMTTYTITVSSDSPSGFSSAIDLTIS